MNLQERKGFLRVIGREAGPSFARPDGRMRPSLRELFYSLALSMAITSSGVMTPVR